MCFSPSQEHAETGNPACSLLLAKEEGDNEDAPDFEKAGMEFR